eukprot:CAMPEP_0114552806 /NCGR_PEP_ID=MMETSP0114-20121206/7317_1 /TAXON_ID=31324 /ORGANISM="Goniomonas sp, Strain m" /LENGTH=554 /DNA_ID=CAMNT_0001737699 /DNA_START=47 /DNA_END=1711 /DNA_ORIENTATION=+
MAFTTRGMRMTDLGQGSSTTPKVGPGSYADKANFSVEHAYAPFSSTSERDTSMRPSNFVTPGPGTYNSHKKPSSGTHNIISQTAPRFKANKDEILAPGPGAYEIPTAFKKQREKRPRSSGGEKNKRNVMWFRSPTAPSIPVPSQAHGYEETPMGELVRQQPPVRGYSGKPNDMVGPGAYNSHDLKPVITSKSTDFGRSRAQRIAFKPHGGADAADMPGPGNYDWGTTTEPPPRLRKPTATFVSRVLRAHQQPVNTEEKKPGPGEYDSHLVYAIKSRHVPEVLQCFGSTSRRGDQVNKATSRNPGPGAYKEVRTAFETTKKKPVHDGLKAPFASSASRFAHNAMASADELPPGPGAYDEANKHTFVSESQRHKFGRCGHFGSSTKRFPEPAKDEEEDDGKGGPGPGAYEPKQPKQVAGTLRKGPSSVFASSSGRFADRKKEVDTGPAPGQYQTVKPWVPKAYSRSTAFISTSPRFKGQSEDLTMEPGPGSYMTAHHTIERRQLTQPERPAGFGTSPRFREKRELNNLGPGAYSAADPYGGLIKRSFNVTVESGLL